MGKDVDLEEMIAKVYISWGLCGDAKLNASFYRESFIYKVLSKKIKAVGLADKIKIPDHCYLLLELCSKGNPGYSQIMLRELIKNRQFKDKIIAADVVRVWPDRFPNLDLPEVQKEMLVKWDMQKVEGCNLCDTVQWWVDAYEEKFKDEKE